MRIVLFSDVHGNVAGLEAVLASSNWQCSRTSAGPMLALVRRRELGTRRRRARPAAGR